MKVLSLIFRWKRILPGSAKSPSPKSPIGSATNAFATRRTLPRRRRRPTCTRQRRQLMVLFGSTEVNHYNLWNFSQPIWNPSRSCCLLDAQPHVLLHDSRRSGCQFWWLWFDLGIQSPIGETPAIYGLNNVLITVPNGLRSAATAHKLFSAAITSRKALKNRITRIL